MRNDENSRKDYIIYMVKFFLRRLGKVLKKTFIPVLLSIVSSVLGLLALYVYPPINRVAMIIAAAVFFYSLFEYTFRYSFLRKHSRPYWFDVLIPWGLFSLLAYAGYFFIQPKIFNYIFLPLRVCELFNLRSRFSILIALAFMLFLISITRRFGRNVRRRYYRKRH